MLAFVGANPGPERVIVKPTPPHDMVSLFTQPVANDVVIVELLAALLAATVVRVKVADPLGLLIVTTEFAGKALNSAAAMLAGVEVPS